MRKGDYLIPDSELFQFCIDNPYKSPTFQFYANDYLGSGRVAIMNLGQRGLYISLLVSEWGDECCSLPTGLEELRGHARCQDEQAFNTCWTVVRKCFVEYHGRVFNRRLCLERRQQILSRLQKVKAGKESALSRSRKTTKNSTPTHDEHPLGKRPTGVDVGEEEDVGVREGEGEAMVETAYTRLAVILERRILEHKQIRTSRDQVEAWANTARLMAERDSRKLEDIEALINECHDMEPTGSGFTWRDNILSMDTLRKQWNAGKISLGMNAKRRAPKQFGPRTVTDAELRESTKGAMEILERRRRERTTNPI